MDFENREDKDGVRLSWSSLPRSKLQHQRNVIPFGSLYTPLNDKSAIECFDSSHLVSCRTCRSILNPFVHVNNQIWTCQFCNFSNQLPITANEEGETILPIAINPELSTIEYETGRESLLPPIFFYVVDVCFEGEDVEVAFSQLKENLIISLSLLPENALVGFVSFGKHVKVHDLTSHDNLSYTFNGSKTYALEQVQSALGLLGGGVSAAGLQQAQNQDNLFSPSARRFLQPVNMVEYELTNIIENMVPNAFSHSEFKERADRATGSAINVSTLLLKSILGDGHLTGGHLMVFLAGVCTIGPGKIVDKLLKTPLRSHHDIVKSQSATYIKAPTTSSSSSTKSDTALFKGAKKFYADITKILVTLGLSCDIFIGSYDQVGLFEMEELCCKTGGVVVMSDSFSTAIFKQSFTKFFKKQETDSDTEDYLDMGFNATIEVKTSSDLKIEGLIGNATALPYNKLIPSNEKMISVTKEIGESKTNCWKLCSVDPQSTYAIYFEKLDSSIATTGAYLQYLFHYQHPSGRMRLRVTTIPINIIPDSDSVQLELGFDQEAALVLIAREAVRKLQTDLHLKVTSSEALTKQLDQSLIDFCSRFAVYNIGVMESFRLSNSYSLFPQFLYHLRRSPFINVFNSSPDETSYVRHIFMHEDLANSLLMIQPTLLSYDINTWNSEVDEDSEDNENEPIPVLLDSMSLGHSKILLLDTFFQILIYHGSQIADWRKAGYHEQEDYAYFKNFLEAPKREALLVLTNRFPLPRFIDCDEGGSQARFLMAKLNPSTSYATNVNHFYGYSSDRSNTDIFSDESSFQMFIDHIQRIVTSKK
ncbi:hypothetical protein KGF54_005418 [Candida jiufengensis]|uniref:uncharacterized protein n=1 Tax=Candida jiufengensis TaxID=497108 RepID=UPI002224C926|nr:uncharacterized protein KGF54_005418 [Candida jiufengensis]KAI5949541.1 hypothetical protein KGF54_005418 [Candida jiufengensis]